MDGLHRTCELPEIVRKIIFTSAVFCKEDPSFSLDSQRVSDSIANRYGLTTLTGV